uniref:Restriction endonuclease subunit S n=1 Tax=Strongyloides papillosus TaxID=174720 RepID=A0A0N5CI95_STREA
MNIFASFDVLQKKDYGVVPESTIQVLKESQVIPDGWKIMTVRIEGRNVVYVNGKKSPYFLAYYKAPFTMSGQTYESVHDVYQVAKLNELCGNEFARVYLSKRTIPKKRAFVRD